MEVVYVTLMSVISDTTQHWLQETRTADPGRFIYIWYAEGHVLLSWDIAYRLMR